jgi:Tol biopolymer transport system component
LTALLAATVVACPSSKTTTDPEGPTNPDLQPLSENTLVFKRFVRKDSSGGQVFHLYTYDTVSKKETLLSNLDDTGTHGTDPLGHMAISPDRRSIAFAALFRPTQADLDTGLIALAEAIWTVSADGQVFKRLTPPFDDGAPRCTADAECVSGTSGSGTLLDEIRADSNLAQQPAEWLPDGTAALFLVTSGDKSAGAIFSMDLATGELSQIAYAAGLTSFALAPDGKKMALCVVDSNGQHLLLADRTTPDAPPTPLAENGCHPAW